MFSSLTPFTEYMVTIVAVDSMGRQGDSSTITVTTNTAAPDNFMGTSTTSTSITLSWSPPTQGTVQSYKLTITGGGGPATVSPPNTTRMFSSLTPFTEYMVTIVAVDSMGRQGDSSTITVTTDMAAPSPPRSLQVVISSGTSVTLQWTAPAVLGDSSVDYIIDYGEPGTVFTTTSTMFEVTGLASNTAFTFRVRANNSVGTSEAVTVQGSTADVPEPVSSVSTPQPESSTSVSLSWTQANTPPNGTVQGYLLTIVIVGAAGNSTNGSVSVDGQSTTTTTLTSLVPGIPYFVEVRVQESMRGLGLPRQTGVFFSQETDADASAQVSGLTLSMDNTRITWDPLPLIQARHFFNYTITYSPSGSGTQNRQTPMIQTLPYSNCTTGCSLTLLELPVDVNYTVTVTITRSTNPGVSVTLFIPGAAPPMDTAVVAIAVGIVGAVVVAILIAVFIFCIVCLIRSKKSDYAVGREKAPYIVSNGGKEGCDSSENLLQLSNLANEEEREAKVQEHTRIILLEDFPSYVKGMHKDRDAGFEEEYKLLKTSLVAPAECAQKHTHKNRYGNIFAYDHSRVVLQSPDDDGVDYINASYIEGYHTKNCYIATQGPVPSSVDDFWQMVWEQRSPVIVMLTKIEEAGRKKCELYWPEKEDEPLVTDRNVKVTLVGLQHYADFEIRDFHITKEKSDKPLLEVKHFLYTVWPDHGVPQYATSVIKFIRRVRKSYPMSKDNKPIVIHCSAGVGRTGTYICLDVMLQRMNAESNFNVFEFVTAMRSNRTFMVQTMDQYIFIHDAIDELIVCGDTSIPSSNMRIKVNKMHKQLPGKDATVFEHQFELLQSVSHTPQSAEISEALSESNKPKNRNQKYIPYNLSRPRLLSMGIHNGADYINASYVDAYKESNYFILTQSPLYSTIKEFWLTVWQVKSACLVMLCDKGEGKLDACVQFWPEKTGEETLYGKISVTFKSEEESEGFVTRKFEISEEGRNSPPNRVTLLHYCWPDEGCPTDHKPLLKIIGSVEKIQQATGNNPIVVMCQDGTGRSGAFAQIVSQIERMKVEGTVDYFQSIKLARIQRAHLVYSQELYVFCHEFLLSYLDSFEGYSNFEFKRPTK
jgi:netrin-G3 ligand